MMIMMMMATTECWSTTKDKPYYSTPKSELAPETPTECQEAAPDTMANTRAHTHSLFFFLADSVSVGPLPSPLTDSFMDENTQFWGQEKLAVTSSKLSSMGNAIVNKPTGLSMELADAVALKTTRLRNEFQVLPRFCVKTIMPSLHSQAEIFKASRWKRLANKEDLLFRMKVWTARHNVLKKAVWDDGTPVSSGMPYGHSNDNTFDKELAKAKNKEKKGKGNATAVAEQLAWEYPSFDTSVTMASTIPTDGLMTHRYFASHLVRKDFGIDGCCEFIHACETYPTPLPPPYAYWQRLGSV